MKPRLTEQDIVDRATWRELECARKWRARFCIFLWLLAVVTCIAAILKW